MSVRAPLRPRDRADLYLAPLLLSLDERLEGLAPLNPGALSFEIMLATNQEPRDLAERAGVLLDALGAGLDLRGWELSLDSRGLRVARGDRMVVLGLPTNIRDYLVG